jgi:gamma-glutamyl-gamma-aminobutyrate hydrolase PuuD
VLLQPYTDKKEAAKKFSDKDDFSGTYIPAAHVNFLEAAGARIIPINYRMREAKLDKILSQINGIYIPGDSKNVLENEKYMECVAYILSKV